MSDQAIRAWWFDRGAEPRCPPDPAYPNGVDVDMSRGAKMTCTRQLDYPAKRCGSWYLVCDVCGISAVVTTAGRADDPRSVKLPCRIDKRPQ